MENQQPSQSQPKGSPVRQSVNGGGNKTMTIIASLLGIAVLLLIVNVLAKKDDGVDKTNKNVEMVNMNQQANTNVNTPIDTSDWKTYRNEELGIEFKYPREWKYVNDGVNFVNLNPSDEEPIHSPRVKILVWNNPNNTELYEFYSNLEDSRKIQGNDGLIYNWYMLSGRTKDINVDGKKGINFISPDGIVENTTIVIPIDKRIVEINFYYIEEIKPKTVEGEIVDSLRFVDKSINTSEWDTYKNEKVGFEVKHPQDWNVEENASGTIINSADYRMGLSVTIEKTEKTLKQYINDYNNIDPTSKILEQKAILISGSIPATKLTASTSLGINNTFIYISHGGKQYLIKYYESDEIHTQIVDSFRFTN